MGEFRYVFDNGSKHTCPGCDERDVFRRYVDRTTGEVVEDEDWGRCERINTCAYFEPAPVEFINDGESVVHIEEEKNLLESDKYREDYYEIFRKSNISNTFMIGIVKRFGRPAAIDVWKKYKLATFLGGEVIFPYYFDGEIRTGKIMKYDDDLHRKGYPIWLHKYGKYGYKSLNGVVHYPYVDPEGNYVTPFFGWDVIKDNKHKAIAVVEAEKTAVICSIVFPEFNWIATGGLQFLQPYKFFFYSSNKWLYFPDLNGEKVWQKKLELINQRFITNNFFIDYLPPDYTEEQIIKDKGKDIADYILNTDKAKGDAYIAYMRDVLKKHFPLENSK